MLRRTHRLGRCGRCSGERGHGAHRCNGHDRDAGPDRCALPYQLRRTQLQRRTVFPSPRGTVRNRRGAQPPEGLSRGRHRHSRPGQPVPDRHRPTCAMRSRPASSTVLEYRWAARRGACCRTKGGAATAGWCAPAMRSSPRCGGRSRMASTGSRCMSPASHRALLRESGYSGSARQCGAFGTSGLGGRCHRMRHVPGFRCGGVYHRAEHRRRRRRNQQRAHATAARVAGERNRRTVGSDYRRRLGNRRRDGAIFLRPLRAD